MRTFVIVSTVLSTIGWTSNGYLLFKTSKPEMSFGFAPAFAMWLWGMWILLT
jgi:hypothetical protein